MNEWEWRALEDRPAVESLPHEAGELKPGVRVRLFPRARGTDAMDLILAGKTAGIGLAPLAKLPEIEWIGLHLSDITEADLEHLKGLTKLRRLGLADIRLTDAGVKRLEGMTTL